MKERKHRSSSSIRMGIAIIALFLWIMSLNLPVMAEAQKPCIATERAVYQLGETVAIRGTGCLEAGSYLVKVIRDKETVESESVRADAGGRFTCFFQAGEVGDYEVVLLETSSTQGKKSTPIARTSFSVSGSDEEKSPGKGAEGESDEKAVEDGMTDSPSEVASGEEGPSA